MIYSNQHHGRDFHQHFDNLVSDQNQKEKIHLSVTVKNVCNFEDLYEHVYI